MRKTLPSTLLLCLICSATIAQSVLSPTWAKTKYSPVGGSAQAWGVDIDSNGSIYWPINVDSVGQGYDIVCYKYDSDGTPLWTTPFFHGGPFAQQSYVCNAKDTALYIGGRDGISGFNCDMLLLKVDTNTGTAIWDREYNFGNNGYDEIDGLVIKSDGIYVGGWAQALQTGPYQCEVGLLKLDFNGDTIWTNHFGKTGTQEHQDGHFVVDDSHIYAAGLWGGSWVSNLYNGHAFLGSFSKSDGSFVDSTLFGYQSATAWDVEQALGMTSDGTYLYITGITTPTPGGDWQIFVAKYDKSFNQIWFREWGDVGTESARGILVHNDRIYISGLSESPIYAPGGYSDAVLLEYDTSGTFISYHTWGDGLKNGFRDLAYHDNALYLSGTSTLTDTLAPDTAAFLLKIDLSSLVSTAKPLPLSQVNIFPNPFSRSATLEISDFAHRPVEFKLYDIQGHIVHQQVLTNQRTHLTLDVAAGVYYYYLNETHRFMGRGKIMVR